MPNEQEITTKKKTVSMMSAQKSYIESISKGLENLIGNASQYQCLCGYNILNQINVALAKESLNFLSEGVDKESINNAIKYAMVYELNTDNAEVFVNLRHVSVKVNGVDTWKKAVEVKPQYRGHLKILKNFGADVKNIYPEWIVREGDDFTYQTFKGIEVIPPTWTPKSQDGKIVRVVVPIERKNGFIDWRIAERESIATNIKAQIKQSLMKEKDKQTRVCELIKDMTFDELLADKEISSYINDTYTGISQEQMIITKLIINATKRVAIDFKNAFIRELTEKTYDNSDVYVKNHNAKEILDYQQTLIELQDDIKELEDAESKSLEEVIDNE